MDLRENDIDHLKEIYYNDNRELSVSIKSLGVSYAQITVTKHFTPSHIIHLFVLLVCNYFLTTNFLYFVSNVCWLFLYITTIGFCTYKIYTTLSSPKKQSIIFVNKLGLQITTLNLLYKESSEYLSYGEIDNFVIFETFCKFSVMTYLSCLLKNKDKHKILFGDFSLKLAQQEIMYQSIKQVLFEPS